MHILIHPLAKNELKKLGKQADIKLRSRLRKVEQCGQFTSKYFKKLFGTKELYEIRISLDKTTYRAIGVYFKSQFLILVVFQKKTRKTPKHMIVLADRRFKSLIF